MNRMPFSAFPLTARLGIIFTIAGWCFFILAQAATTSSLSLLHITLALVSGVMVYSLKPLGRIFCIIINLVVISSSIYALYSMLSGIPTSTNGTVSATVHVINILLFSLAAFYLIDRRTSAFYKQSSSQGKS